MTETERLFEAPAAPAATKASASPVAQAQALPVAGVVVDTGLPHLDRVFDYSVPSALDPDAVPGARVRVRFAGRDLDGFVVVRRAHAEHEGRLHPLRRVVSPEPVLLPEVLATARAVADRGAGTLGDVLRLAVPKRHAAAEKALPVTVEPPAIAAPEPGPWTAYPAGASFLRRLASGQAPKAAWLALPGRAPTDDWPTALAVAAAATLASGRGALVVVPDHRDVDRLDAALTQVLGRGAHVRLTADQGPQARYTAWLKLLRGHVRCVVGTRAAAFAPVRDLGLLAAWDDGDDLMTELRSPYPHVRDVLIERARHTGAGLLLGGFSRSVEAELLVRDGVLAPVAAAPAQVRLAAPRVIVAGDDHEVERDGPAARAHLPSVAWRTAKQALERGPVLVQVPRRGYLPSLSCAECREPVRCPRCHGPMGVPGGGGVPTCRWCGATFGPAGFRCPHCEATAFRTGVIGARRTAEELGRAFPGVPVRTSGSGEVLAAVGPEPALVIATPGAEPVADGRYAATLLLDAWALLDRASLDAAAEALRRWTGAAALTRGSDEGGLVVLAGVPAHTTLPPVEALVRWDPAWLAARELDERTALGLPPAAVMAQVVGPRAAVLAALAKGQLDPSVERLGPLPFRRRVARPPVGSQRGAPYDLAGADVDGDEPLVQVLLRATRAQAPTLARALQAVRAGRSARKEPDSVLVRMDPVETAY
ncbi:primosomal protein N' [Dermatophilaceae bacterium Soc4.6]